VRETGGTLAKAELEWHLVRAGMLEAASMPHRVTGSIMPSDIPGEESRVYRQSAGVVAVISPWNFPFQLSRQQLSSVRDKVERAVSGGARQLLGENGVATAKEEVFGPVITIIPAASEQDALEIANDTDHGLSSAVFTRDAERGVAFALSVQAGMTPVNDSPTNDDANTAFGGVKASGIGRFGGHWAIEEFTTDHWVSVQREPRSFPVPASRR
jgi:acyl-CoA reductase-like NAD-dependent aldehyde dehydrogenase